MTTINNSENLIERVGGIEKAREIIAGAPGNAVIYWPIAKGKFGVYSAGEQNKSDRQIILDDLHTAIAEHDEQIKCWSCDKYMTKSQHSANDGFCIHCSNEVDL